MYSSSYKGQTSLNPIIPNVPPFLRNVQYSFMILPVVTGYSVHV